MKAWLEKKKEADAVADKEETTDEIRLQHYGLVDEELGKLIVMLDEPDGADGKDGHPPDSEAVEILSLYEQAEPARYIHLAAEEKPLDGAESELNAALKMTNMRAMPLGLMLRDDERRPNDEQLADVVTAITTKTTVNTSPIAARVFKQTAAGTLGFQMPTVGPGTARYPFLTAGTTASVVARGASVDAAAATLATVDIDPVALQATYILDRDTILQNGNEVRTLLESDLRMVMGNGLDDEILRGDGDTPTRTKGLFPFIKDVTISGENVETATTWAQAEAIKSKFVDSQYFMEDTATRMLIGLDTYRFLRTLRPPATLSANQHALAAIRADGVNVIVRDRGPAAVAAVSSSNGKYQDALYVGGEGPMNVVIPIWNDMEMLVDPYSSGRKRQIQMTLFMYFGMGYRRRTLDGTDMTIGAVPGVKKVRWVETNDS